MHVVADPDLVLVTRQTVVLGVRVAGEVIPDYAHHLDPIHITQVEPLPTPPRA